MAVGGQSGGPVRRRSRLRSVRQWRGHALAKCWRNDPPRREDQHYTTVIGSRSLASPEAGLLPENMTEEREPHVLKADSPEECAAWDVWVEELKTVRQLLLDVWNAAEVTTEQALAQGYF